LHLLPDSFSSTMRSLYKKIVEHYILHLPFPKRGFKHFERFMKHVGLERTGFVKRLQSDLLIELGLEDHIEKQLFWYGHYEKKEMDTLLDFVNADSIVMDVGANIGYVSLLCSGKAPYGKIISFEPGPSLVQKMNKNLELNAIGNVLLLSSAVGEKVGSCLYYESSLENTGMSGLSPAENYSHKMQSVPMTTLDQVVIDFNLQKVDLVKIDVEGSEESVLKGMQNVLKELRPFVFMEISAFNLKRYKILPSAIFKLMADVNYRPFQIIDSHCVTPVNYLDEASLLLFKPAERPMPSKVKVRNT